MSDDHQSPTRRPWIGDALFGLLLVSASAAAGYTFDVFSGLNVLVIGVVTYLAFTTASGLYPWSMRP